MVFPPGSSIQTAMEKTSVEMNGVWVRFNKVLDNMVRFCRPMAFYNPGSEYELSIAGTCFLARYMQKLVLISTRHQLGKTGAARQPNEACIVVESGKQRVALTCSQYIRPSFVDHEDHNVAEDIILLQFGAQTQSVNPANMFFDMTHILTLDQVGEQNVKLYFAIGYPTQFTELVGNFDDPDAMSFEGYVSRFSKLYLETDRRESMPAHIEFRVRRDHTLTIDDFDGLSGSPVFFLYEDGSRQSRLGYAGMVRLASNSIFHVYEGRYIKQMLEAI
jgi:hypothetical protein